MKGEPGWSRRAFLGAMTFPAAGVAVPALFGPRALALAGELATHSGSAAATAGDESFWFEVQQAFTVDRSLINFNNGGVSPSPAVVQGAMKRYQDYSNTAPTKAMWEVLEPQREGVRQRIARQFGCDAEEIALTRNASESLQICQLGLDLARGDEVLTSTQDYPRMLNTFQQREQREGLVLVKISLPVPAEDNDEVVRLFEQAITPRTRVLLVSHMINLTGQILPVRAIVEMAEGHGIPVIVDGAHTFAHFPFSRDDLGCDYYGTSLHKWLFAPHGTGMLYVRRDRIAGLWSLMAPPPEKAGDIRKYEEIGTHPAAPYLAVGDALTLHEGIGPQRKAARLIYLRDRWVNRLLEHDRVRLHTSRRPGLACGIATVQIDGLDSAQVSRFLWREHRIITVAIKHDEFEGVRVSPSVYSTLSEIERFVEAMEGLIRDGLPTDVA